MIITIIHHSGISGMLCSLGLQCVSWSWSFPGSCILTRPARTCRSGKPLPSSCRSSSSSCFLLILILTSVERPQPPFSLTGAMKTSPWSFLLCSMDSQKSSSSSTHVTGFCNLIQFPISLSPLALLAERDWMLFLLFSLFLIAFSCVGIDVDGRIVFGRIRPAERIHIYRRGEGRDLIFDGG